MCSGFRWEAATGQESDPSYPESRTPFPPVASLIFQLHPLTSYTAAMKGFA